MQYIELISIDPEYQQILACQLSHKMTWVKSDVSCQIK